MFVLLVGLILYLCWGGWCGTYIDQTVVVVLVVVTVGGDVTVVDPDVVGVLYCILAFLALHGKW